MFSSLDEDFYWDLKAEETKTAVLKQELNELKLVLAKYESALELIAAPKRPDGTYNRCREACEELAREVLGK